MKKILLAVAAVAAFASCSQNEEFENVGQKAEIGFNTVVRKATRAADTNGTNFLAFTVSSYVTDAAYDGTSPLGTAYMNAVDYTKVDASSVWTTTDDGFYYWPSTNSGKKVQFFAYPASLKNNYSVPAEVTASSTGYPSITFAVSADPASQTDLVVAHAANVVNTTEGGVTDGKLTLDFKHVLTRVNFAYIPADEKLTYEVTGISIADVKGGTATYNFNANSGSWDLTTANTNTSYSYKVKQSKDKVTGKGYYSLADVEASWMLLPQDVAKKVITITYSTKQGEMEVFNGTKTVTLPDNAPAWGIGQNVLYVLTLPAGAEKVKVDTNIGTWNGETENPNTAA